MVGMSAPATSVECMNEDLEIISFVSVEELWNWLAVEHSRHPGCWVRLQKNRSTVPSIGFHDLLEAGIAYGWSESTRRSYDSLSYLQRFTPRRTAGTTSLRNLDIADRLKREGWMQPSGRRALAR